MMFRGILALSSIFGLMSVVGYTLALRKRANAMSVMDIRQALKRLGYDVLTDESVRFELPEGMVKQFKEDAHTLHTKGGEYIPMGIRRFLKVLSISDNPTVIRMVLIKADAVADYSADGGKSTGWQDALDKVAEND